MIKFFREMRQNKLSEGKTIQYAKYALGEILLVVIGILIALQINNWNENRKDSHLQVEILKNINDDLKYNALNLKRVYESDSKAAARNRVLLSILKDPESVYDDSLQIHFGTISRYEVFAPRKMAYETLKSEGLEVLKNDNLRSEIIELYDESYLLNSIMIELKKDIHISSNVLFTKRLFTLEDVDFKIPVDFEALKEDTEFINKISYIAAESVNFIDYYKSMLNKTESVNKKIVKELKRLENL